VVRTARAPGHILTNFASTMVGHPLPGLGSGGVTLDISKGCGSVLTARTES
jgi:hypothetical protein